jgi:N-acetylglucosaminyl-diphospho-decaprenol L-rhamnosyltransferase
VLRTANSTSPDLQLAWRAGPAENTQLSIVIVNWNTRQLLAECLASVYAHPPGCEFEVVVADNGSTDGSCDMVRQRFRQARLIENRDNLGFARANNRAIRASSGQYILLLNSDTRVLPGSLTALVRCADDHPDAGVVGGKLLNPDGSFQSGGGVFPTIRSELALLTGTARWFFSPYFPSYPPMGSQVTRPCDWVGGGCLLARRIACAHVGLLDEGYFMYSEEVDWCYRMRQAGWGVLFCADAAVLHYGGGSAKRSSFQQMHRLYASKVRFLAQHRGDKAARLFRASVRLIALAQASRWFALGCLGVGEGRTRALAYLRLAQCSV